jgi:hypothetical protein
MTETSIIEYIRASFDGVDVVAAAEGTSAPEVAWGDTFFMYDPVRKLKAPFPFATIVTKDYGDFDNASNLNRPGVFRLNLGLSRTTYESLFGPAPGSGAVASGHDFTALDRLAVTRYQAKPPSPSAS